MSQIQLSASNNTDASLIYNYHRLHHQLSSASAIFCLCSLDKRVAVRAADLYLSGLAPLLIFSGGEGSLTERRFDGIPEAEVFAAIARNMGVPDEAIVVESRSTNTGENVRFTYMLLEEKGLLGEIESFILVQKPYMERRTYATFVKQWPGTEKNVKFNVTSPVLEWDQYPNEENPRELVINVMVGDLVRIREYPAKGFQIPQEIPPEVWAAAERLINAGYREHLP
ncbi:DUF218 domain-containing protein [Lentinula aff. detonsa]|uniref:DUF218 domain-containing protein n=1 Tax=Lentinula aff. detonsa TaxID=2804958 RepID=A0AA38NBX5_9AGAR|nr:DUF218 domain-containing protein [Lentinula aff. detonsa]